MTVVRSRSPRAALLAVAALLAAVAALAVVTPPPADAQVVPEGRVLTTATWTWGSGGPPGPGEECTTSACQRYQHVIDNFFQKGATTAFTTIEIEDITDRNGNITGVKATVRCLPDYNCSWNGQDVRDEEGNDTGAFTDVRKAVNLNEREEYEEPSEQDVARQRSPVGSVGPQPRGRTVTWTKEASPHCGEMNSNEGEYRYYVVDDPDNPKRCVLYDPEESHRHPETGFSYTDPDTGLTVRVKDALPATMPLQYHCQGNHLHSSTDGSYTLRGSTCTWTVPEYSSPQEAQQRAPTLTTPGAPPVYEPPTQRQIDACNRRSDHESCLRNLEIQAANEYDRAAERYDAAWQRYQQELDNLADDPATDEDERQQYWACIPYDEWEALVEDGVNSARCFLVN